MKKYTDIFRLLSLIFLLAGIISCDTLREADQEVSEVISAANKVKIESFSTNFPDGMVTEGQTITFDVTIDQTIERSISFNAHIVGGSADDHDIHVTPGTIKPFYNSATVEVEVPTDWDVEGDEPLQLEFGVYGIAERYLFVENIEFPVIDFTIKNFVSDVFDLAISWDKDVEVMEEVEKDCGECDVTVLDTVVTVAHAGAEVDYDFLICPVEGFNINDPWGSFITYAATGDHPEVFELSKGAIPDGEYYIAYDLWANGLTHYVSIVDSTVVVPTTAEMVRQGTALDEIVVQPAEEALPVYVPGYDDNGIGMTGVIAKIVVSNGEYSIVAYDGSANKSATADLGSRTPSQHGK